MRHARVDLARRTAMARMLVALRILLIPACLLSLRTSWAQVHSAIQPAQENSSHSSEVRSPLERAASSATIQPWQREFMLGLRGSGDAHIAPRTSGGGEVDGQWDQPPPPTARRGHAAVYDPVRDRMLVFGGIDGGAFRSDVWVLNLAGEPKWTAITPSGTPPSARYGHAAVYDPLEDRVIIYGGDDGLTQLGDVWTLSLSGEPSWSELSPEGTLPPARELHTAVYDSIRGRMIVFGGYSLTGSDEWLHDTWSLSLVGTPAWSEIAPEGAVPVGRAEHTCIYDPARDRMLLFGGGTGSGYRNDTWMLSFADTVAWSPVSPSGTLPPIRAGHTAVYDQANDQMLIFAGRGESALRNDVWALNLGGTPSWTDPNPDGTLPLERGGHATIFVPLRSEMVVFGGASSSGNCGDTWVLGLGAVPAWHEVAAPPIAPTARQHYSAMYDPPRDRMILFGGAVGSSSYNDVWELRLASMTWRQLSPTGTTPPGLEAPSAIYDAARNRMLIFGGINASGRKNSVWALNLAGTPTWTSLSPAGVLPPARFGHTAIYDPVRDRMIVFGGHGSSGVLNDTWALSLAGVPAWSPIASIGNLPAARWSHSAIYDPRRDHMIVCGGLEVTDTPEVWVLALGDGNVWSEINPSGVAPAGRRAHTAVHDPVRDRMIVFGGIAESPSDFVFLDDVWALQLGGLMGWSKLSPAGPIPPGRWWHSAIYDPQRDQMVVYGGNNGTTRTDLWRLRWEFSLVGIQDREQERVMVGRVFPNPTRSAATIRFSLPEAMPVTVTLYDVSGRLVRRIIDSHMPAGTHTVSWNAGDGASTWLPQGMYFCRVRCGRREFTENHVVLH